MATAHRERTKHVDAGTVIFQEGDAESCVYQILAGRVEISKTTNGKSVVLARLGRDHFFGEMSLVLDTPRSASA